jgi:hypothetical protein
VRQDVDQLQGDASEDFERTLAGFTLDPDACADSESVRLALERSLQRPSDR